MEISTPFVATSVGKRIGKMRTSIALGVICLILAQLDFGEGSAIGVVDREISVQNHHEVIKREVSLTFYIYVRYSFLILKANDTETTAETADYEDSDEESDEDSDEDSDEESDEDSEESSEEDSSEESDESSSSSSSSEESNESGSSSSSSSSSEESNESGSSSSSSSEESNESGSSSSESDESNSDESDSDESKGDSSEEILKYKYKLLSPRSGIWTRNGVELHFAALGKSH